MSGRFDNFTNADIKLYNEHRPKEFAGICREFFYIKTKIIVKTLFLQ